jgi:hypothetical protein
MRLNHGLHLAYCTNVHRGETWPETFESLRNYTLKVRQQVCPDKPFAIGLRLSNQAAQELNARPTLLEFQRWLGQNQCYVFTINGFPFGQFHGKRVKEQVYMPDWTSQARLDYTNLLFDLLAQLLPPDVEGSVSTVPCGFKELVTTEDQLKSIRDNLWHCVEHVARVSSQTGRRMHLGLEPEPLCVLETSNETIRFFERLRAEHRNDSKLFDYLGVNYDTCHLAVEFEEPKDAIGALAQHGIKISKIHLSSALKARPTGEARKALTAFVDDVYLHQVVVCRADGRRVIYRDLDQALAREPIEETASSSPAEWRIHFHIPLHSAPTACFDNTTDHLLGVLDLLQSNPKLCSHLEMETYTWEVLPPELRNRDVVDQLVGEYDWTLSRLAERGLFQKG